MREASEQTLYIRNLPASLSPQQMLERVKQAGFKAATLQQINNVRYKLKSRPVAQVRALEVVPAQSAPSAEVELRRLITKYGTDLTRHVLEQVEATNAA